MDVTALLSTFPDLTDAVATLGSPDLEEVPTTLERTADRLRNDEDMDDAERVATLTAMGDTLAALEILTGNQADPVRNAAQKTADALAALGADLDVPRRCSGLLMDVEGMVTLLRLRVEAQGALTDLREAIGCRWVEACTLPDGTVMFMDEEPAPGTPVNLVASVLAGTQIVGNAVLTSDDDQGDIASVRMDSLVPLIVSRGLHPLVH